MKRKFPVNIQLDSIDCGPTCLKSIAEYYGKFWSLNTLRQRCYIGNNGVSLLGISEAAESIGLRTAGVKLTYQQLRDEAVFPCIVHWNQEHFVVVYDIKRKKIMISLEFLTLLSVCSIIIKISLSVFGSNQMILVLPYF